MALGHPVPTDEGWLFLAAVKDLYTCEIVALALGHPVGQPLGWAMDKQMTKQLAIDALRAAYWRKKPPPWIATPFGPRQSVLQRDLPSAAGQLQNENVHESQRRLLG